jgi:cytochrome c
VRQLPRFLLVVVAAVASIVFSLIFSAVFYSSEEADQRGFSVAVADGNTKTIVVAKKEEIIDIAALMAAADPVKGAKTAKKCFSCHTVDNGGSNKTGPNLWNIVGSDIGGHAGYKYSSAVSEHGGKWGYEELFAFLKKPKKYIPGTKMSFNGFKKPKDIANVVAYLREQSDTPLALPEVSASADVVVEEMIATIEEGLYQ